MQRFAVLSGWLKLVGLPLPTLSEAAATNPGVDAIQSLLTGWRGVCWWSVETTQTWSCMLLPLLTSDAVEHKNTGFLEEREDGGESCKHQWEPNDFQFNKIEIPYYQKYKEYNERTNAPQQRHRLMLFTNALSQRPQKTAVRIFMGTKQIRKRDRNDWNHIRSRWRRSLALFNWNS